MWQCQLACAWLPWPPCHDCIRNTIPITKYMGVYAKIMVIIVWIIMWCFDFFRECMWHMWMTEVLLLCLGFKFMTNSCRWVNCQSRVWYQLVNWKFPIMVICFLVKLGHVNIGIIFLCIGNSQCCFYAIIILIGCSTLSQEYCMLIGLCWKTMRRHFWAFTCPIDRLIVQLIIYE